MYVQHDNRISSRFITPHNTNTLDAFDLSMEIANYRTQQMEIARLTNEMEKQKVDLITSVFLMLSHKVQ